MSIDILNADAASKCNLLECVVHSGGRNFLEGEANELIASVSSL